MNITFEWIAEDTPGAKWRRLFGRAWPAYRAWFLSEGDDARPSREASRSELATHMPELVPLWERLVELAGGGDQEARMLSLVDPAPYLMACSCAVWPGRKPLLVRNYDYRADAFEGVVLMTRWHETRVLASSDCLWGVLDGINEHGLCVALSFGGSRAVGPGFGIPLILRYVLEFCETVDQAAAVLRRTPTHMAYNVLLLDASGSHAVAHLSPDRPADFGREGVTTNHQPGRRWSQYAELTQSEARHDLLAGALAEEQSANRRSAARFLDRFLAPPLYMPPRAGAYGTLYGVAYQPAGLSADFFWPSTRVAQSIRDFSEMELIVETGER